MKAKVTIRTWKDAKDPTPYKRFEVDTEETFLFEANDLYEAELKVLRNFPAKKCIGFTLTMENGDFTCQAVKDYWHGELPNPTDEAIRAILLKAVEKKVAHE